MPTTKTRWLPKYEAQYGLRPTTIDPDGSVRTATCGFCSVFGREGDHVEVETPEGKITKRSKRRTVKSFSAFRADNIKKHLISEHPEKFNEFSKLPMANRRQFFTVRFHSSFSGDTHNQTQQQHHQQQQQQSSSDLTPNESHWASGIPSETETDSALEAAAAAVTSADHHLMFQDTQVNGTNGTISNSDSAMFGLHKEEQRLTMDYRRRKLELKEQALRLQQESFQAQKSMNEQKARLVNARFQLIEAETIVANVNAKAALLRQRHQLFREGISEYEINQMLPLPDHQLNVHGNL